MSTAAGIIFSNLHDRLLPELTSKRTMASVPFGCRYRLIDFPLSNMVNCGISKIGVVVHNDYQSLMDHIGTGKDWDLARRSGGIKILPPFVTAFGNSGAKNLYSTRLEALIGISVFISKSTEDYMVLSDCNIICNIDLSKVLKFHEEKNADITIVTTTPSAQMTSRADDAHSFYTDMYGKITDVLSGYDCSFGTQFSTNIMVINRILLLTIINDAISRGYSNFYRDVLSKLVKTRNVYAYNFDGYMLDISSLQSYFASSMKLLDEEARSGLTEIPERPIYTKVRNSSTSIYKNGSSVKNSYIADGCEIEGTIENSIIFRGVKVSRGAVIKNSIVLQNNYIGEKASLNCVITDKDVVIKEGRTLSGHETMPFFISKGSII